jgi:hypothetical protein
LFEEGFGFVVHCCSGFSAYLTALLQKVDKGPRIVKEVSRLHSGITAVPSVKPVHDHMQRSDLEGCDISVDILPSCSARLGGC